MRLTGRVEKTWGYEDIFISTDNYCAKYLVFEKADNKTSMHFHKEKDETWQVQNGIFLIKIIDTDDGTILTKTLYKNDVFRMPPFTPHQLIAIEDNSIILEVSTADSVEDNYRLYR